MACIVCGKEGYDSTEISSIAQEVLTYQFRGIHDARHFLRVIRKRKRRKVWWSIRVGSCRSLSRREIVQGFSFYKAHKYMKRRSRGKERQARTYESAQDPSSVKAKA